MKPICFTRWCADCWKIGKISNLNPLIWKNSLFVFNACPKKLSMFVQRWRQMTLQPCWQKKLHSNDCSLQRDNLAKTATMTTTTVKMTTMMSTTTMMTTTTTTTMVRRTLNGFLVSAGSLSAHRGTQVWECSNQCERCKEWDTVVKKLIGDETLWSHLWL